jgi:hypothetical protein
MDSETNEHELLHKLNWHNELFLSIQNKMFRIVQDRMAIVNEIEEIELHDPDSIIEFCTIEVKLNELFDKLTDLDNIYDYLYKDLISINKTIEATKKILDNL